MISCQKQSLVIITIVCLLCVKVIYTENADQNCSLSDLNHCGPHETCEQQDPGSLTGICVCLPGYDRHESGKGCVLINSTPSPEPATASPVPSPPSSQYNSTHIVLGVMIPLALIPVALGLVYAAQRFQWVQRFRAMRQRRYDEVQFGQDDDDPPLS